MGRRRRYELQHIKCVDEYDHFEEDDPRISLTGLQTKFTLTNAVTGEKRTFRVRAKNKHGWSGWSKPSAAVSTSTILPPGVPRLKNAGPSWIEVQWDHAPNGDVVKYVLQYQVAGSMAWRTHGRAELREDSAVVADLKPQVNYIFRIQALTLEGYSVFTDPSEAFRTVRRY